MPRLPHTENIYHSFRFPELLLIFYLLTSPEILCMIRLFLNLLYEVYNRSAQHFQY